jgi:hypothetical protein
MQGSLIALMMEEVRTSEMSSTSIWLHSSTSQKTLNFNHKRPFRSNAKGYGSRTRYTDSEDSNTMASSDGKLYYLLFLVLATSPGTFWYAFICGVCFLVKVPFTLLCSHNQSFIKK